MSNDLISRQAAIDAICKAGCESGYCGIPCDDVKAIEQLPSAHPWIPCSERLPEEHYDDDLDMSYSDPVLATFGGNTERDPIKFWTVIVVFTKDGKWMHDIDRPVKTTKTIGITAWMPFPEPYKE